MRYFLITAFALFISSCGNPGGLDGFKDLKFGMPRQEIEKMGFTCQTDGECTSPEAEALVASRKAAAMMGETAPPANKVVNSKSPVPQYTFLGKDVRVSLSMSGERLSKISLLVDMAPSDVIKLLEEKYGKSKNFEHDGLMGARIKTTYWLFDNESSISINEGSGGVFGSISDNLQSQLERMGVEVPEVVSINYFDKSKTDELMKRRQGNAVNSKDL